MLPLANSTNKHRSHKMNWTFIHYYSLPSLHKSLLKAALLPFKTGYFSNKGIQISNIYVLDVLFLFVYARRPKSIFCHYSSVIWLQKWPLASIPIPFGFSEENTFLAWCFKGRMPHTQDQRSMFWKLSIPSQFLLLVKPQLKVPASGFFNPSFSHCDRRLESADRPLPGLSLSDYLDGWVIDHRRPWRLWRTCITLCVHGRSVATLRGGWVCKQRSTYRDFILDKSTCKHDTDAKRSMFEGFSLLFWIVFKRE